MLGVLSLGLVSAFHETIHDTDLRFHCPPHDIYNSPSFCTAFGTGSVITFDGLAYDYSDSPGFYFLVKNDTFGVAVRRSECSTASNDAFICQKSVSVRYNGNAVSFIFDPTPASLSILYKNGSLPWQTLSSNVFSVPSFGQVQVLSLENQGYEATVSLGFADITISWFSTGVGAVTIMSQGAMPLWSGLCGFADGCAANDLALRRSQDRSWWSSYGSTVFLSGQVLLGGDGRVYTGGYLANDVPLLLRNSSAELITQMLVPSWQLTAAEIDDHFSDRLLTRTTGYTSRSVPAALNADCFQRFVPDTAPAPPFLLNSCQRDVALVESPDAAWGAQSVLLLFCSGFCADSSFVNPSKVVSPSHCVKLCQYSSLDAGLSVTVGETVAVRSLGIGGRYIVEVQGEQQCQTDRENVTINVGCVGGLVGSTVSAGVNKTIRKGWYGYPKVTMDGLTNLALTQFMNWTFIQWAGTNPPVLTRSASPFASWTPSLPGLYELEFLAYDGCAVFRSRVNVTVLCETPGEVMLQGPQQILWASSAASTFPSFQLSVELERLSLPEQLQIANGLQWRLVAPRVPQGVLPLQLNTPLPLGSSTYVELVQDSLTTRTYTIFSYLSPYQVLTQSNSTTTGSTFTETAVINDPGPLYVAAPFGGTTVRNVGRQNTIQVTNVTVAVNTISLLALRSVLCNVTIINANLANPSVSLTPGPGNQCGRTLLFGVTSSTANEPCSAPLQESHAVSIECGPPPVISVMTQIPPLLFNYTSNKFAPFMIRIKGGDPLARAVNVAFSGVLQAPACSALQNSPVSIVGGSISVVPDCAGNYAVLLTGDNGCSSTTSQVTFAATCAETSTLKINLMNTTVTNSTLGDPTEYTFLLYVQAVNGASANNPLPPITYTITPDVGETDALLADTTPGWKTISLMTGGTYTLKATMQNGCNQQTVSQVVLNVNCELPISCGFHPVIPPLQYNVSSGLFATYDLSANFVPPAGANGNLTQWTVLVQPITIDGLFTLLLEDNGVTTITPMRPGLHTIKVTAQNNGCGICTSIFNFTAAGCPFRDVLISGSQTVVRNMNIGSNFTLDWTPTDPSEPVVVNFRWSSDWRSSIDFSAQSQVVTATVPGTFYFNLSYGTMCSGRSYLKSIKVVVACNFLPATVTALNGAGQPIPVPALQWNAQTIRQCFSATANYPGGWTVKSAPAQSVYAPPSQATTIVDQRKDVVVTVQGKNQVFSSSAITVTSTTLANGAVTLPTTSNAACFYPDVPGTYIVDFTVSDGCQSVVQSLTFGVSCPPTPTSSFSLQPIAQSLITDDFQVVNSNGVAVATFSGTSTPATGRVVFQSLPAPTSTKTYITNVQVDLVSTASMSFGWELRDGVTNAACSTGSIGTLFSSGPSSTEGNLTKTFGAIMLTANQWSVNLPVFQLETPQPLPTYTNMSLVFYQYISGAQKVIACAPLSRSLSYRLELEPESQRKLLLSAPVSSGVVCAWRWALSGVSGTNRVETWLAGTQGPELEGPSSCVTGFTFNSLGVYFLQLGVNDGCSSSTTTIAVEVVCTPTTASVLTTAQQLVGQLNVNVETSREEIDSPAAISFSLNSSAVNTLTLSGVELNVVSFESAQDAHMLYSASTPTSTKKNSKGGLIAGVFFGVLIALILLAICAVWSWRKKKNVQQQQKAVELAKLEHLPTPSEREKHLEAAMVDNNVASLIQLTGHFATWLPTGWVVLHNKDGEAYFYNVETKDAQWKAPAGTRQRPKKDAEFVSAAMPIEAFLLFLGKKAPRKLRAKLVSKQVITAFREEMFLVVQDLLDDPNWGTQVPVDSEIRTFVAARLAATPIRSHGLLAASSSPSDEYDPTDTTGASSSSSAPYNKLEEQPALPTMLYDFMYMPRSWKPRLFAFPTGSGAVLFFDTVDRIPSADDFEVADIDGSKAVGRIEVSGAEVREVDRNVYGRVHDAFIFTIKPREGETVFVLSATSDKMRKKWISALQHGAAFVAPALPKPIVNPEALFEGWVERQNGDSWELRYCCVVGPPSSRELVLYSDANAAAKDDRQQVISLSLETIFSDETLADREWCSSFIQDHGAGKQTVLSHHDFADRHVLLEKVKVHCTYKQPSTH